VFHLDSVLYDDDLAEVPTLQHSQMEDSSCKKAGKPVGLLAAADPEGVEAKQFMNCFIEI